jgi:fluoroacetyl-CoA thioesterase
MADVTMVGRNPMFEEDPWARPAESVADARRRQRTTGSGRTPESSMDVGDTSTLRFTVGDGDTAQAVGSGSLPVLATPRLLAWCEATTCAVVDPRLEDTRTSVGTRVNLEHLAASPVGAEVEVTATLAYVDGRLLRFDVAAYHVTAGSEAPVVGHGDITRVVVDRERFLSRL